MGSKFTGMDEDGDKLLSLCSFLVCVSVWSCQGVSRKRHRCRKITTDCWTKWQVRWHLMTCCKPPAMTETSLATGH